MEPDPRRLGGSAGPSIPDLRSRKDIVGSMTTDPRKLTDAQVVTLRTHVHVGRAILDPRTRHAPRVRRHGPTQAWRRRRPDPPDLRKLDERKGRML